MSERGPDLLTLWMIGGAVQEMQKDTKANIHTLLLRGETATKLLARCLPYLRTTEAKALRAEVVALLSEVKP